MYGTYETIDGRPAVRFERSYPHPVDHVWRAVTEPAQLARWFPTTVEADLREGGEMTFTFPGGELEPIDGRVLLLEPQRRFAFRWGDEEIRIELEPDAGGCRLRFTHLISSADAAARNAAGWHVCLDRLAGLLAGDAGDAPGTEATDEWSELYEEYQRRGVPAGAPVPGGA
jgi:uncharacterized protein YndB with AHSA1/START domain